MDKFTALNHKFHIEHDKLVVEVDRLSSANATLKDSRDRIHKANAKNRENLGQFTQLQETMQTMNLHNVEELKDVTSKAGKIGNMWQEQLIERERDMLHTVFDRYEENSGKAGMNKKEFEEFSKQLPESYQKRFARLGTFEKISHDGEHLNFSDFDAALDLFAEMDALDCDIEFTIEKSHADGRHYHKSQYSEIPTLKIEELNDKNEQDDDGFNDISTMKRWKTRRKKYDDVKRKIVVHSRTFRSKRAKEFTTDIGLGSRSPSSQNNNNGSIILGIGDHSPSASSDASSVEWGRDQGGGLGRTITLKDRMIHAGRDENKGLLNKNQDK